MYITKMLVCGGVEEEEYYFCAHLPCGADKKLFFIELIKLPRLHGQQSKAQAYAQTPMNIRLHTLVLVCKFGHQWPYF